MQKLPTELSRICHLAELELYMQVYKEVTGVNTLQALKLLTK